MNFLSQLENTSFVAVCFCVFMAILTLVVYVFRLCKKTPMLIAFNKRMLTLWVLILCFVPVFLFGSLVSCLFFAALSMVAITEYRQMMFRNQENKQQNILIYVFLALQYIALYTNMQILFVALIPFSIFLLIPFEGIFNRDNKQIWQNCVNDYVGLLLTVYAMSYMCAYTTFPQIYNGKGLLLFVLILTLMSDFFQAICGYLFGKHNLTPILSPHKTWEGLIGGGILTALLAWLMGIYVTPFDKIELLVLGFVLNMAAFCGDVTISAIKRYVGVKDCSNLLPGHGGFLDRFDSILLVAPVLFWYVLWLY